MGSRVIEFEGNIRCDECETIGAYDFMGDYLCDKCANIEFDSHEVEPVKYDKHIIREEWKEWERKNSTSKPSNK